MGESVRLRLSPRLLLIPTTMGDTDTDSVATTVATTESVRLRLSPRLPLIPTTTVDTDTEDTVRGLMVLDTDTEDSTMESKKPDRQKSQIVLAVLHVLSLCKYMIS